jgi:hypothetical protein
MESKFNRINWYAEFNNYDLEKFNYNFFEYLLKDFGLFITNIYKSKKNTSQTFLLENGQFSFTVLPENKWCSISLMIPYNEDFDIIKFKNTIKIGLNTEKINDTLDLIYREKNI